VLNDGLRDVWKVFWPLLGASLLVGMALFVGTLFLIVPGIILYFGFTFVAPVVVLERSDAVGALGRSWKLATGRKGKIFLVFLIFAMMVGCTSAGLTMVLLLSGAIGDSLASTVLQTLISQAVSVLATPIWYIT